MAGEDPVQSARSVGLRYTTDRSPGIRRETNGGETVYRDAQGRPVHDGETLARIRALAIPPAWTDVWICPSGNGHLQATGRDARGRKQYRYHARWREVRDENKFDRMALFAAALPRIRAAVARDLATPALSRRKVLATVVRLLDTTFLRVGNDEYARANRSYGLTTLEDRHVEIEGARVRFRFRGKSGKDHEVEVTDRRVAGIVKRCRDLPGEALFAYVDSDGAQGTIDSSDVNAYLREVSGEDFTAKDFRTWAGTLLAAAALRESEPVRGVTRARRTVAAAIRKAALRLGNTPAVCRKHYVHPEVLDAYLRGRFDDALRTVALPPDAARGDDLRPEEVLMLAFLRTCPVEARHPGLQEALERSLRAPRTGRKRSPIPPKSRRKDTPAGFPRPARNPRAFPVATLRNPRRSAIVK